MTDFPYVEKWIKNVEIVHKTLKLIFGKLYWPQLLKLLTSSNLNGLKLWATTERKKPHLSASS